MSKFYFDVEREATHESDFYKALSKEWTIQSGRKELQGGFTLVEMLVVITIMLALTAITLKMMPGIDEQRVRESSEMINSYLNNARNRAMETGRPCGVTFHALSGYVACSMNADQCEVPTPYAGDDLGSKVKVGLVDQSTMYPGTYTDTSTTVIMFFRGGFRSELVSPGDLIQVNHQNVPYKILPLPTNPTLPWYYDGYMVAQLDPGQLVPWDKFLFPPTWNPTVAYVVGDVVSYNNQFYECIRGVDPNTVPVPDPAEVNQGRQPDTSPTYWAIKVYSFTPVDYQITRRPRKVGGTFNSSNTLQLPSSSVVDLNYSGVETRNVGANDFTILFAPSGGVDSVYYGSDNQKVVNPIFFLVGQRERIGQTQASPTAENKSTWSNVQDLNNRWVVVNPLTGKIETCDIAAGSDPRALYGVRK